MDWEYEEEQEKMNQDKTVTIPLDLAWTLLSILTGIVIQQKEAGVMWQTGAMAAQQRLSELLEPYRSA